jgi:hypothetical protein
VEVTKTISKANEVIHIDCSDIGDGNMRCLWRDDSNQEHVLYYNKMKEYIRFSEVNRHWIALLKARNSSAQRSSCKPGVPFKMPDEAGIRHFASATRSCAEGEFLYIALGDGIEFCAQPGKLPDPYNRYNQRPDIGNVIYLEPHEPPDP